MAEPENHDDENVGSDPETQRITFHYIKGNYFRSIHMDGAMGSISPSGNLHIAVYNERRAIPRTTIHNASSDGELIDEETIVDGREGYVREIEADLVMSREVAASLAQWINSILARNSDEDELSIEQSAIH